MKYKTKIVPEYDGYVGYVILNEEVVYTTSTCKDPTTAAQEITMYISSVAQNGAPVNKKPLATSTQAPSNNYVPPAKIDLPLPRTPILPSMQSGVPSSTASNPVPSTRKCCGR